MPDIQSVNGVAESDIEKVNNIAKSSIESINGVDMTAVQFLQKMAIGKLHKAESITRCRRKLQELHLNLRGKKYEERKNTMTKNWIEELRKLDTESKGATHEQS